MTECVVRRLLAHGTPVHARGHEMPLESLYVFWLNIAEFTRPGVGPKLPPEESFDFTCLSALVFFRQG